MPNPSAEPLPRRRRRCNPRRGFTEIPLHAAGHNLGRERFARTRIPDNLPVPYLNAFRNNLTALSQNHNLYFVAYEDVIHVFRPTFPDQRLSCLGLLAISLLKSSPHLFGYMPNSKPHSVNNLLVADLGQKEILLCACDDGDVLAFWTDAISTWVQSFESDVATEGSLASSLQQVERPPGAVDRNHPEMSTGVPSNIPLSTEYAVEEGLPQEFTVPEMWLRPFLHVNVGLSAWGLAVHSDLRLIAVSSNGHRIHVFAYGLHLTGTPIDEHDCHDETTIEEDNDEWEGIPWGKGSLLQSRGRNYFRVLCGHYANIPAITFDNSTSTQGRLISSDISGRVITWDVDTGVLLYDMHGSTQRRADLDVWTAGWGLLCIDRRAFRTAPDIVTAVALCSAHSRSDLFVVDTSLSRLNVPKTSAWQPWKSRASDDARTGLQAGPLVDSSVELDEDFLDEDWDSLERDQLQQRLAPLADLLRRNKTGEFPITRIAYNITREEAIARELSPMYTTKVYKGLETEPLSEEGSPLMILHPQGIHLLQTRKLSMRDAISPVIFLKDPLYQPIDNDDIARMMHRQDRLNLYCQIPELGVVLVGSPKGRVAVLTLWKLEQNPFCMAQEQIQKQVAKENPLTQVSTDVPPVFTFRLDHILPLARQEEENLRPLHPLIGLCGSPLQGCSETREGRLRCRRWRVLLMYMDHTMLSYELTRHADAALDLVATS